MPVYHFTLHAYRSWRADNRRGYVHHTKGLQKPSTSIAEARDRLAKFDEVKFDETIQRLLIRAAMEKRVAAESGDCTVLAAKNHTFTRQSLGTDLSGGKK